MIKAVVGRNRTWVGVSSTQQKILGWLVSQFSHSTNACDAPKKSGHTAGVLLEYTCAAVAFPNMSLRRQIDCNAPVDSPFLIRVFLRRFGGS